MAQKSKPKIKILRSICKSLRYYFAVLLCILGSLCVYGLNPAAAAECDDVKFIFARGSGEPLGGPSMTAWRDSIRSSLDESDLKLSFYELGTAHHGGYQYPAVSVSDNLSGYINMLGAYVGGGAWFDFGKSVDQGAGELKAYLKEIASSCPQTKFVLGGYSQGAMLISRTLSELDASRILYVATFGDPKVYLPEGNNQLFGPISKIPDACQGKNLSQYRAYVPNCYTYEGVLGSYRPYQPSKYSGKLGTWCNNDDIMCSPGFSLDDHISYVSTNLYDDAARTIATKIAREFGEKINFGTVIKDAIHEVAILVDSTGSMSSLINQYSAEAKKLAERVLRGGGRVSLFEYRDLTDGFVPRQHCDFSCTIKQFNEQISRLDTNGGGDTPESALSAILTTMNSLKWTNGATKSLVLLTDAPYHTPDYDGATLEQVIQRSLEIDPVNIYVMTDANSQAAYQSLAEGTNGKVFDIATGLADSTEEILNRPIAKLNLREYIGKIGDQFTFDASSSYAHDDKKLRFDWDLDGDGVFERLDSTAVVSQEYAQVQDHFVQVKVTDQNGASSTMSARLNVNNANHPPLATITEFNSTALSASSVKLNYTADAEQVLLVVDDLIVGLVPLRSGKGEITLGNLRPNTKITLVPYRNNRRGQSHNTTISPVLPKVPNTGIVPTLYAGIMTFLRPSDANDHHIRNDIHLSAERGGRIPPPAQPPQLLRA